MYEKIIERILNKKEEPMFLIATVVTVNPVTIKFPPDTTAIPAIATTGLHNLKVNARVVCLRYGKQYIITNVIGDINLATCILETTGTWTISTATTTTLGFGAGTEILDELDMHDETTNNSRITIPKDGVYLVSASGRWEDSTDGSGRIIYISINGSTVNSIASNFDTSGRNAGSNNLILSLEEGDYVQMAVYQASGGDLIFGGTGFRKTHFCVSPLLGGTISNPLDLTDIESDISDLQTDVATNTSNISTNTTNISNNTSDIADNASDISTNAGNISTNTTNISTNTTNISNNASDISDLQNDKQDQIEAVRKTADESVTSSTTLQNDNHLTYTFPSAGLYEINLNLSYTGDPAGDILCDWATTGTVTIYSRRYTTGCAQAMTSAYDTTLKYRSYANLADDVTYGAYNNTCVAKENFLINVTASSTITFRWAQDTSSTTATTVQEGSYLTAKKVTT